jgi:hypothetical protein
MVLPMDKGKIDISCAISSFPFPGRARVADGEAPPYDMLHRRAALASLARACEGVGISPVETLDADATTSPLPFLSSSHPLGFPRPSPWSCRWRRMAPCRRRISLLPVESRRSPVGIPPGHSLPCMCSLTGLTSSLYKQPMGDGAKVAYGRSSTSFSPSPTPWRLTAVTSGHQRPCLEEDGHGGRSASPHVEDLHESRPPWPPDSSTSARGLARSGFFLHR